MNHRSRIQIDRNPIIKHACSKELYVITIVLLLGSIAFACSEGNDDDVSNTGNINTDPNSGNLNTDTDAANTGNVDTDTGAGNIIADTDAGNVNIDTDAGNVSPGTGAGTGIVDPDSGNGSPTADAGNTGNGSSACPDGSYWDISYDLPTSTADPGIAPDYPSTDQNALLLRDTMFAIGDGNHSVGPGTAKIRFESVNGKPGGKAYLLELEISIDFTAPPATTNLVGTMGYEYEGPCGSAAVGTVEGDKLTWSDFEGTAHGTEEPPNSHSFFMDGTITCDGPLCGSFGAPPQGTTPNSGGPYDIRFDPWTLGADASTFSSPPFISQKDVNSTTRIQLYGVEVTRECMSIPVCE